MPEWVHTISGWSILHKEHLTLLATLVSAVMAVVITALTRTLASENRMLRKAGTEPDVVAYLLPNPRFVNFLNLVVANVGRGPARNVVVEFIGDLTILQKKGAPLLAKSKLPILSVLPQDERFVQFFGSFLEFSEVDTIPDFTICVHYQTSKGENRTSTSRASISDFLGLTRVGNSPEHDTAEALQKIAKSIEGWSSFNRLKVETFTAAEIAQEQKAQVDAMEERKKTRGGTGSSISGS